ncbi:MAG: DUF3298/DUF4163 domain-containing protein [Pedobacter sp.]|nr:MAG: DUF3298/DUF4163 domain-containing protein [Pedobacter sp.]
MKSLNNMKKLGIILSAAVMMACNSEKKADKADDSAATATTATADSLFFHYDSVKVYSKNPVSKDARVTDTAKAVISYPVFSDKLINAFVEQRSIVSNNPDKTYDSYKAYVQDFMNSFDDFQKTNKDRIQTWFLDVRTEVVRQQPGYLSMISKYANFQGGAHPNYVHTYLNYDPLKHREIILDSLLLPGAKPKLNAIAEQIFRKNEKLGPTESLKDKYFFENDTFKLNENFTVTDQGLKFLYNPYEIKAYVFGITELTIPFSQLTAIAKPNSLLSTTN